VTERTLLLPALLAVLLFGGETAFAKDSSAQLLLDFGGARGEPEWVAVNDGVMGGLSEGGVKFVDGQLHFSGLLSLENDGGFASVRSRGRSYDLSGKQGVLLRVKGDGRTYRFRISTDARFRGGRIAYGADFGTKAGEWIEVRIPFRNLTPTHHGEALDGPPLNLTRVEEIGFQIGDNRSGPFAMTIDWMKVE